MGAGLSFVFGVGAACRLGAIAAVIALLANGAVLLPLIGFLLRS